MLLSPNLLIDNSLEGNLPSISISLLNNNIQFTGISKDKLIFGTSIYPLECSYLIIDNIPNPIKDKDTNITIFWDCFWYIEKAFKAFRLKDWEAFGINLDKAYLSERQLLKINQKCDLIYTSARIAGCYGGYPNNNKLFLVCPSDKIEQIKKDIDNAIRDHG